MLNTACSPFSLATSSMTGMQPLLELPLQLVLQVLHLGLGVLLRELDVALQLVDLLVERRPRGVAEHRAAGRSSLVCSAWSCLFFSPISPRFLLVERGELLDRFLAGRRRRRDRVDVDEGDLRVLRERHGRCGLRRRRGRGRRRRGGLRGVAASGRPPAARSGRTRERTTPASAPPQSSTSSELS